MSKEWGILYHHGGRLRKDNGWSEKESDNPPDKFWKETVTTNFQMVSVHIPTQTEQHMLDNTKMV